MKIRDESTTETWYMDAHAAGVFMAAEHLGRRRTVRQGTTLYRQGDLAPNFYFIVSGRVQVEIFQESGAEFILEVMGSGALMGEGSAVGGQRHIATATTLEACVLIEFNYAEIRKALADNAEFAATLMEVVAVKQWVLGTRIQFLATPRPDLRIVELLTRLAPSAMRVATSALTAPCPRSASSSTPSTACFAELAYVTASSTR